MAKLHSTRRALIKALIGLIGGWGLWKYLAAPLPRTQAELHLSLAELPGEGALVYADRQLAVVRRGGEIYALSLVCTHLGCTLNLTANELQCPCHGSRFDHHGHVLSGPAPRDLPRLPLRITGDQLYIALES
ncbi:MAG: ubiquinol-cytochrome c reductase iron-sulfur subunit [Deltaproteobacteria bacterium]|nr:ubiquinol-cytochrome c reductase iron-sulfur subunit [Deltaproteobacteria bacterium]NCP02607.1 ubiquinol-cytochrome c reductase iron-sulfur subunit [Deltaproteobacteria bacterium]